MTSNHNTSPLTVWYGPMPESNGKTNWTAILHRGDLSEGHTIDRSEYPERVRYEADRVRYLIGEILEEPDILEYDTNKHSEYEDISMKSLELNSQQLEVLVRVGHELGVSASFLMEFGSKLQQALRGDTTTH